MRLKQVNPSHFIIALMAAYMWASGSLAGFLTWTAGIGTSIYNTFTTALT